MHLLNVLLCPGIVPGPESVAMNKSCQMSASKFPAKKVAPRIDNRCSKTVDSGIVHKSQKVEAAQIVINR